METRREASEQKQTPTASSAASHLSMEDTHHQVVQTKERDGVEGNTTNRWENQPRDHANGPTAPNMGRIESTPTHQTDANVNPLPAPTPQRQPKARPKEPLQDQTTPTRDAGTQGNQHSPRPKQGRDAGSGKERREHANTTALKPVVIVPNPMSKKGMTQKPPDRGTQGVTQKTTTSPRKEVAGTFTPPREPTCDEDSRGQPTSLHTEQETPSTEGTGGGYQGNEKPSRRHNSWHPENHPRVFQPGESGPLSNSFPAHHTRTRPKPAP